MKKFQPKSNRMQALKDRIEAINEELAEMGGDPMFKMDHPSVQFLPHGFMGEFDYKKKMEEFRRTIHMVERDKSRFDLRLTVFSQNRDMLIEEKKTEKEIERVKEGILATKREINRCKNLINQWKNQYVDFMDKNTPLFDEESFDGKKDQLMQEKMEKLEELRENQLAKKCLKDMQ